MYNFLASLTFSSGKVVQELHPWGNPTRLLSWQFIIFYILHSRNSSHHQLQSCASFGSSLSLSISGVNKNHINSSNQGHSYTLRLCSNYDVFLSSNYAAERSSYYVVYKRRVSAWLKGSWFHSRYTKKRFLVPQYSY